MKLKYIATALVSLIIILNLVALYVIEGQVQAIGANTGEYVAESNKMFINIICKQQIQGEWDLNQCPK